MHVYMFIIKVHDVTHLFSINPSNSQKKNLKFSYGQNKVEHVLIFSLNIQSIIFDKITTQSQSSLFHGGIIKGPHRTNVSYVKTMLQGKF